MAGAKLEHEIADAPATRPASGVRHQLDALAAFIEAIHPGRPLESVAVKFAGIDAPLEVPLAGLTDAGKIAEGGRGDSDDLEPWQAAALDVMESLPIGAKTNNTEIMRQAGFLPTSGEANGHMRQFIRENAKDCGLKRISKGWEKT